MKNRPQLVVVDRLDEIFDELNAGFKSQNFVAACQEASTKIMKLRLEIEHRVNYAAQDLNIVLTKDGSGE